MARLRAVETGRMHLAATNTGITAAIDRDGLHRSNLYRKMRQLEMDEAGDEE